MRIVYILDNIANIGGTERILSYKMNYFADFCNYEVFLITASQGSHSFAFNISSKIHVINLDINFHHLYKHGLFYRLIKENECKSCLKQKLEEQLSFIKPDFVISTTYCFADIVCSLKNKSIKIVESHCNSKSLLLTRKEEPNLLKLLLKNWKEKKYIRTIEKKCDILVTLTDKDADFWKVKKRKIVLPNSLTFVPTKYSSCMNKKIIAVGSLIEIKGFDMLIKSWSIVSKKHPDWTLDIFGDGKLRNNLQDLIINYDLEKTCFLNHSTSKIDSFYLDSSIFVLSSKSEGFPMALLETMSYGLACVSFNCPNGPSAIINDNYDGILVEPNNINKLAESINYLIENDDIRKEYGINARKNILRFRNDVVMALWTELFENSKKYQ